MDQPIHDSELIDLDEIIDLNTLAQLSNTEPAFVIELVNHSVIVPIKIENEIHFFECSCITVTKRAARLHRDLEINPPGIALALELIDRIDTLERQLALLQQA